MSCSPLFNSYLFPYIVLFGMYYGFIICFSVSYVRSLAARVAGRGKGRGVRLPVHIYARTLALPKHPTTTTDAITTTRLVLTDGAVELGDKPLLGILLRDEVLHADATPCVLLARDAEARTRQHHVEVHAVDA